MIHTLPEHFPFQELPASDQYRIRAFYRQFVEEHYEHYRFGHFLLAAYASVPAFLTPDLIHKIWQNFNNYRWAERAQNIHRIAPPDILLSSLCREVGYDLYEMYEPIRQALNSWLHQVCLLPEWQVLNIVEPQRIAKFVYEYHALSNPGTTRWGKGYLEPQLRDTLVYLAPEKAQERLLDQLKLATENKQESETVRVLNSIAALDRRVQVIYRTKDPNAAPALRATARFAEAWKALIQQYDEGFLEQLRKDPSLKSLLQTENLGWGLPVVLDQATLDKVDNIPLPTLHALLIGMNWFEGREILEGCVNDIEHIQELLDIYSKKNTNFYYPNHQVYTDDVAKEENIKNALKSILQTSKDGDSIIIYYSGSDLYNSKGRILTCYDSRAAGEDSTGLYQSELEEMILELILVKRVHVLLVMDTCFRIKEDQYRALGENKLRKNTLPIKGSLVIYFASEIGKNAQEIETNGKKFGLFTNTLLTIIGQHELLDYQTILEKIREITGPRQIPQLEAYGSTAAFYEFLTGKPGKQIFQLAYNRDQWLVSAGRVHDFFPSMGSFPTLLRTNTGVELSVTTVEANHSLVELQYAGFYNQLKKQLAQGQLDAVIQSLLQLRPEQPEYLELAGRLYRLNEGTMEEKELKLAKASLVANLLTLLKQSSLDYLLDKSLTYECILLQKAPEPYLVVDQEGTNNQQSQAENSKFFSYFTLLREHPNPHFLLRGRVLYEPLSQSEYLLSLVNLPSSIILERLDWACRYLLFQKIEGKPSESRASLTLYKIEGKIIQINEIDELSAEHVAGAELLLNYFGERYVTAFRCKLPRLSNSTNIYPFLFSEQGFQIQALRPRERKLSPPTRDLVINFELTFPFEGKSYKTCLLDNKVLDSGEKTEVNFQLNILLSKSPLRLDAFAQPGFDLWSDHTPNLMQAAGQLNLQEWNTIRVPIKVIRREKWQVTIEQFQQALGHNLVVPQFLESVLSCLDVVEKDLYSNVLWRREFEAILLEPKPIGLHIQEITMHDLHLSVPDASEAFNSLFAEAKIDKEILSLLLEQIAGAEIHFSDIIQETYSLEKMERYSWSPKGQRIERATNIVYSVLKARAINLRLKIEDAGALQFLESAISSYLDKGLEFFKNEGASFGIRPISGKRISFAFKALEIDFSGRMIYSRNESTFREEILLLI